MIYQTLEGVLHPDGKIAFSGVALPNYPVRVMVTLLDEDAALTNVGDYAQQLADYEERLARGDIQWQ